MKVNQMLLRIVGIMFLSFVSVNLCAMKQEVSGDSLPLHEFFKFPKCSYAHYKLLESIETFIDLKDHISVNGGGHKRILFNPDAHQWSVATFDPALKLIERDCYPFISNDPKQEVPKKIEVSKLCGLCQYKSHLFAAAVCSNEQSDDTLAICKQNMQSKQGLAYCLSLQNTKVINVSFLVTKTQSLLANVVCQCTRSGTYEELITNLGNDILK